MAQQLHVVQAYWFYRPAEVPETAWGNLKKLKKQTKGCAAYKLPDKHKLMQEDVSERQVCSCLYCTAMLRGKAETAPHHA